MNDVAVSQRQIGNTLILDLTGKLTATATTIAQQALETAMNRGEHIVVNLRGVEYMDRRGLDILVLTSQQGRKKGRRLSLVNLHPYIKRVFELADVSRIMPVYETETAALAAAAHPIP